MIYSSEHQLKLQIQLLLWLLNSASFFGKFFEIVTTAIAAVHFCYLNRMTIEDHAGKGCQSGTMLPGYADRFQCMHFTNGTGNVFQIFLFGFVNEIPGFGYMSMMNHQFHTSNCGAQEGIDGNDILIF